VADINLNLKRGEVRQIEALLQDGNGAALDMTGPPTIRFQMRKKADAVLKVDRVATLIDAPTAHVRVTTTSVDTDTIGNYIAEWRVTYAGGDVLVPEEGYITVKIWEDLAP
jgi:hypothetical protein